MGLTDYVSLSKQALTITLFNSVLVQTNDVSSSKCCKPVTTRFVLFLKLVNITPYVTSAMEVRVNSRTGLWISHLSHESFSYHLHLYCLVPIFTQIESFVGFVSPNKHILWDVKGTSPSICCGLSRVNSLIAVVALEYSTVVKYNGVKVRPLK